MATENITLDYPDIKEIIPSLISSLSNEMSNKLELILNLSKIALILHFVYFIILIISKIYKIRDSINLKRIAVGVKKVNEKLDIIVNKKDKKK